MAYFVRVYVRTDDFLGEGLDVVAKNSFENSPSVRTHTSYSLSLSLSLSLFLSLSLQQVMLGMADLLSLSSRKLLSWKFKMILRLHPQQQLKYSLTQRGCVGAESSELSHTFTHPRPEAAAAAKKMMRRVSFRVCVVWKTCPRLIAIAWDSIMKCFQSRGGFE